MKGSKRVITLPVAALTIVLCGCPSPHPRFVLDPIPMDDAIRIVNTNAGKISGTLKATGFVDGQFTDSEGRSRSYHLDGVLFYLAPIYVRFDLKSLGDRQLLLGSNAELFWYYSKQEDRYRCGYHDGSDELASQIPIRPDQIVDALGLTPIPCPVVEGEALGDTIADDSPRGLPTASGFTPPTAPAVCVQRVVDEHQQILFLERDEEGRVKLEKEYWLDRYWPRLIRRVVFRDADGVVEMRSRLDKHKPLSPGGPMLPGEMAADWPKSKSSMRFRVRRWSLVEQVGPNDIQFATPRECTHP